MKLFVEILLAIFLHPIAAILAWINIFTRTDLDTSKRIIWTLVCILWGIGPILYMLLAEGTLW